jgi:hypothetical protein
MTKGEARDWVLRWRLVSDRQARELRALTPDQKLGQLADLCGWIAAFGWDEKLRDEERRVRDRWNRLRRIYRVER